MILYAEDIFWLIIKTESPKCFSVQGKTNNCYTGGKSTVT